MTAIVRESIGEMVRDDYRLADIFKRWGISYCCGENGTLEESCTIRQLDREAIEAEIAVVKQGGDFFNTLLCEEWPAAFIIDYIIFVHHDYVRSMGLKLQQTLRQYVPGHKIKYPYLALVETAYNNLYVALLAQIKAEEAFVFPYLKQLSKAKTTSPPVLFGTSEISNVVPGSTGEADNSVANRLAALRLATNNYRFGEDACTNHRVIYHQLKEFDCNLVQHTYLENTILFPKALQLEKELRSS